MPDESIAFPVVWIGLEEVPIHYANIFISQFNQKEFIVSIGQFAPPALMGTIDEQRAQAQKLGFVPIRAVARIALTPERLSEFIAILTENKKQFDQIKGTGA